MSDHDYAKRDSRDVQPIETAVKSTATVAVQTDLCFDDMAHYSDSEITQTGDMKRKLMMDDVFKDDKSCKFYTGIIFRNH